MRVNDVLSRVNKKEIIIIVIQDFYISGHLRDLIHDNDFIERKIGDCFVTHLRGCQTSDGIGIFIECVEI